MDEKPLIWTTMGNLPIKDLEYKYWWVDNDIQVSFHEQYLLNGVIVKEGAHIKLKKMPEAVGAVAGAFA